MASEFLQCPSEEWTQINVSSKSGIIELVSGDVILTEQSTLPTVAVSKVAPNGRLSFSGQERRYTTAEGNYIFAYALEDAKLSVTPDAGDR